MILAYREEPRIRYYSHACIGFHFSFLPSFLPFEILIIRAKMLPSRVRINSRFDCGHEGYRNLEIPEGGLKADYRCIRKDELLRIRVSCEKFSRRKISGDV